jgi:hypothetical protein
MGVSAGQDRNRTHSDDRSSKCETVAIEWSQAAAIDFSVLLDYPMLAIAFLAFRAAAHYSVYSDVL